MSDETTPQENLNEKLPEAPKMDMPAAPVAPVAPVAPAAEVEPAAAAPSFELPKAKFGIANKAAAAVQPKQEIKIEENPSIISVAIDGLAAAVAVAFAIMIVLDI
jgi:hypothetical protein